jgi:cytochrome P450
MARKTGDIPILHTDYRVDRPAFWHYSNLNEVREARPFYWNNSTEHGFWMVTRYEHVREAIGMPEVFSNRQVNAFDKSMELPLLPQNLDGEPHRDLRGILNPYFAPQVVQRINDVASQRASDLVGEIAPRKSFDFAKGFAMLYPTEIFLSLVNLPVADGRQLLEWVEGVFEGFFGADEAAARASEHGSTRIKEYFAEAIAEREKNPGDPRTDLITRLLQARAGGEALSRDDVLTVCMTVLLAGLDTTRSALGYIIHHLAHDTALRQQLAQQPEAWPAAIDEFLRLYTLIIQDGRQATRDIDFHGCPIQEGDMLWLGLAQANRDPRQFERPDEFVMNRPNIRDHLAFSTGQHRCLGSHLARAELLTALRVWHQHIPDYRVREGTELTERGGQLRLQSLPLEWD